MLRKPAKELARGSGDKTVKFQKKDPAGSAKDPEPQAASKQPDILSLEMLYSDSMFDSCW